MNKILIVCFLLLIVPIFGQQLPFYNHYNQNPFVLNPSQVGIFQDIRCSFTHNQRYTSFKNIAVNDYLTVDANLSEKHGIGLIVGHQAQGIYTQLLSSLVYSYSLPVGSSGSDFRFGVSGGFTDNRINTDGVIAQDYSDPYLTVAQNRIPKFDAAFGASFNSDRIKCGFSIPQLIGGKVNYAQGSSLNTYTIQRHFLGHFRYDYLLSKYVILKPGVIARYVPGAPLQYDVQLQAEKLGRMVATGRTSGFWFGASYKSNYSVEANAGICYKDNFRIGYSYEYAIASISQFNSGANHEIFLGIAFNRGRRTDIQIRNVVEEKVVEKIVEKEVEKVVYVEDTTAMAENTKLLEQNRKLQEEIDRLNADKIKLAEGQKELEKENQTIQKTVIELTPKVDTTPVVQQPLKEIPIARGYDFIGLDKVSSPDGFYVISGVFSSAKNAENSMGRLGGDFENVYLIVNQKNNYYYVVLKYTLDQSEAEKVKNKYQKKFPDKEVWILNYIKP